MSALTSWKGSCSSRDSQVSALMSWKGSCSSGDSQVSALMSWKGSCSSKDSQVSALMPKREGVVDQGIVVVYWRELLLL